MLFFVFNGTASTEIYTYWRTRSRDGALPSLGPRRTTISGMRQRLSGDRLDPEEARIRVIALFGQACAFRVARALALRMTGWSEISAPQADASRFVILSQL